MKLTKIKGTSWNGRGFGTSSASWALSGNPDWYISSRSGDWFAINQKTGQRVSGYTREILLEKLSAILNQGA